MRVCDVCEETNRDKAVGRLTFERIAPDETLPRFSERDICKSCLATPLNKILQRR